MYAPNHPTVIADRFHIGEVIRSEGVRFTAYAHDEETAETVVVKARNLDHWEAKPDTGLRLMREADVLTGLDHKAIPKLIHTEFASRWPAIVMSQLDNRDELRAQLMKQPDHRKAVAVCLSTLDTLGYVHEQGIVHRDIKPANLLFGLGIVGLTDFELALCQSDQIAERIYKQASGKDVRITSPGLVLGTADYLSPEAAFGHAPTPQSDLYSLGVTLYSLVFGKMPFTGNNDVEVVQGHAFKPINLREGVVQRDIPADLIEVIARATRKNPNDRYAKAADMTNDLAYVLSNLEAA